MKASLGVSGGARSGPNPISHAMRICSPICPMATKHYGRTIGTITLAEEW
jgi:hypothetical protein